MKPEEIRKILTRDGLAEAEEMTGASYKESKFTESMGFMNHLEIVAQKKAAMLATDDTTLSTSVERYLRIAKEIGFKIVLVIPFKGRGWDRKPVDEAMYVLWRDGILLCFDTFGGTNVNGGKFYYNWRYTDWVKSSGITSSGCCAKSDLNVWIGDHDCREAFRFHISELERHGAFLSQWIERPFLWLLHYMDTKDANGKDLGYGNYDSDAINEARIAMLPEDVRKAISPAIHGRTDK